MPERPAQACRYSAAAITMTLNVVMFARERASGALSN
jgi:hypothetical protein